MPQSRAVTAASLHHLGYSISGVMRVVTEDGQEIEFVPSRNGTKASPHQT
jgi:hypothetical protein